MNALAPITFACGLAAAGLTIPLREPPTPAMQLGKFCVCLTVKDIQASKAFYEKLDFKQVSGDVKQKWIVLQNGTTEIGLFQGIFEKNLLAFNPGWTTARETLKDFDDVREIQRALKERGLKIEGEADPKGDGPASFTVHDPDGNAILFDQYVAKPKKQ